LGAPAPTSGLDWPNAAKAQIRIAHGAEILIEP
jgi:hypothetical protein